MEPLEIFQVVAVGVLLVVSVCLDRKCFFMLNAVLFTLWGLSCLLLPRMTLTFYATGTPTGHHVVIFQCVGAFAICQGVACWMFCDSDERVKRAVLSALAQTVVGKPVVFGIYDVTVRSSVPEKGEKGRETNEIAFKTEIFFTIYITECLFLLACVVQYLRSPSMKHPTSDHVDRPLTIHMSIIFYYFFYAVLLAAFSPDVFIQFLRYPITDFPSDLFLHSCVWLWASFALVHCLFIYNAMDFVNREDKGKVFQIDSLYFVMIAAVVVYAYLVGTYTLDHIKQVAVMCAVMITNNLLGCWRCKTVDSENRESKKRS